jgi:hypothetical protein
MKKVFNQFAFRNTLLEYVNVIVINVNGNPSNYFVVSSSVFEFDNFIEQISDIFYVQNIPKGITNKALEKLKRTNSYEEKDNNSTYLFEFLSGADFFKEYVKEN